MNKEEIVTHLEAVYKEIREVFGAKILKDSFIAGGCIASLVNDEPVNDYDVWFPTQELASNAANAVHELLTDEFGFKVDDIQAERLATTPNATTVRLKKSGKVIQFVHDSYGAVEQTVRTFDFVHSRGMFVPASVCDSTFIKMRPAFISYPEKLIKDKQLVFTGELTNARNTLARMAKFVSRGYIILDDQLSTLVQAINDLDLSTDAAAEKHLGTYY